MRIPPAPLPRRHGLEPARLWLPADGTWATTREFLAHRLPTVAPARIASMLTEGGIVGLEGPLGVDSPYRPGSYVWLHRDLPDEVPVPFAVRIVYQDKAIVVVDKPHFLATIPRGRHIVETALVRLRRDLELPDLIPAHRLDRVTAGLVLFVIRKEDRGAYQTMFHRREVDKEYEAVAGYDPALSFPCVVRSRIVKDKGTIAAYEVPGEPNAETHIELIEHAAARARYRLHPTTGRTHQLRIHLAGLGIPIVNDDIYPVLRDTALDDYRNPLQLLAKTLAFTDPLTKTPRRFESTFTLVG